jgi:hypothetical protein
LLKVPASQNGNGRFPQLHCGVMECARFSKIANVFTVAANDCALACFHDRQQRDLNGTPVEEYAAPAAVFRAQNARFHQGTQHFRHIRWRFSQLEGNASWRSRKAVLVLDKT